ncbi:spore coat protein YsxE [Bacillus aquiflavi]|uniref:spore coat protein YsxE n=1 Tax=Bacillus aquiflavi TaxID=2672567 RepID=UPI001CA8FAC7|nr:spore coat protein YsxE [Bacillus aquiflavi]UAC47428.1 spore coat protein YsxE [Bacillus aquiflavi]
MDEQNRLKHFTPILKQYSLKPYFVEDFGNIQKVYSNKGVFALKKITPFSGIDFIHHVQFLYQKGYNRIVPIYPTIDGRYGILDNHKLYYLMPWLSNEMKENRDGRHKQLFRELARLHTLSAKEIAIDKDEKTEHYENTVLKWQKDEEFINGFIEICEKNWYMSPFELLFCLYFNDINQALRFAKGKLEEWYEKTKEETNVRAVIIHGKVSTEHFLYDDRGYGFFINFENSKLAPPFHDLLPFLSRSLKGYPKQHEACLDWIYTYFKYFPFKEDELSLFLSYFAYPGSLIRVAQNYYLKKTRKKEFKFVQQLQQEYWHMKNIEYIVMKIDESERQKKHAQEGAKE